MPGRRVVRLAESWTMDAPDELLAAAVDITRAASGLAAQRFLEGVPVSRKADDSEVTPADIEVEGLIRSLIAARFPGDGVVGEVAVRHGARRWLSGRMSRPSVDRAVHCAADLVDDC
jgi:3'-phosphoadenosine 5'-phosphosulfate (PAPS) 3'-phosphatase